MTKKKETLQNKFKKLNKELQETKKKIQNIAEKLNTIHRKTEDLEDYYSSGNLEICVYLLRSIADEYLPILVDDREDCWKEVPKSTGFICS